MRYVEAPNHPSKAEPSVFLAGGITGCPDWQQEIVEALSDTHLTLFNPRRADFPIHDPSAAREQIEWEFIYLTISTAILFWFPCETLCPIVLYELGRWAASRKRIFVGVHPDYQRRQDVEIQLSLARGDVTVVYSLAELAAQVKGANL